MLGVGTAKSPQTPNKRSLVGATAQGCGADGLFPPEPDGASADVPSVLAGGCTPADCALYGKECTPEAPVGACMVSSEGTCRIWSQYGGRPDLRNVSKEVRP